MNTLRFLFYCTPAVAKVPYELGFFRLFVCHSVCNAKSQKQFFLVFFLQKSDESRFLNKCAERSGGSKKPQKWPKNEDLGVWAKVSSIHMYFFLNMIVIMVFKVFAKNHVPGSWIYGPKSFRPIKMQDFFILW